MRRNKELALLLEQLAHGLRNELYFRAQVAPQAGSVLVFFTDKALEIPLP